MSIPEANAFNIGVLIALYERTVGFYGSLVNINAYDQPGVEAGKKAATRLLELQKEVRAKLIDGSGKPPKKLRVPSTPTRKTYFMCCDIWRATIRISEFCAVTNRPTINFRTATRILETKAEYGGAVFRRSN